MDETPVFLDLVPSKVVDKKGKKLFAYTQRPLKKLYNCSLVLYSFREASATICYFQREDIETPEECEGPRRNCLFHTIKAWMDGKKMIKWIKKVWSPYVSGKPALLSLDTFSAHFTEKVMDAFAKCNKKLLTIPGDVLQCCNHWTLVLTSLTFDNCGVSIIMVDEAEKGVVSKITRASKSILLEWIKTASDLVEKKPKTVEKSFEVAEIIDSNDQRKDSAYTEINKVMAEVFEETHMGHVQPSDNPFANCSDNSDSEEKPVGICSDDSEYPFGDESSSDLSAGSFSDLSSIVHSDVEDLVHV